MTNYTAEQVAEMVETYNLTPSRETVTMLAEKLDKSEKSIIGKLAREGVYQKQVYVSKTGEKPVTKIEIVREIAAQLDITESDLSGLDKAPKGVLKLLCESI
tara:strand:+ start:405 stop:710 length:306 start_codon:yes stop_codon:yes gene_type:complete